MYNSYDTDLEMVWDTDGLYLENPLHWLDLFNDCSENDVISNYLPSDGPINTDNLIMTNYFN